VSARGQAPARRALLGRAGALAALLVVALVAGGCSLLPRPPAPTETSTPTGERVDAALQPYYDQILTWRPCADGAQCAVATAPLDWEDPGAGDIDLALARRTAAGGSPLGSVFFNPGGPGGSGVEFVLGSPGILSDRLRDAYDMVSWDPRGVGYSSAVECYTDPADFDEFLFGAPDGEVGSEEWIADVNGAGRDFADACAANTGELLGHIDTRSTVRDLDMLRAVVGDERLNYVGFSYGTEIGGRYAELFGEKVGRMVLDGVVDPSLSQFENVAAQTRGFDTALRNYLADCLEGDCPFTGGVDDALEQIADLYADVDAAQTPQPDGRVLDAAVVDVAIASALYDESTWPELTRMFREVQRNEGETAFALADSYVGRTPDGRYPSNFYEAFIAITCLDSPTETDSAVLAREQDELARITPLQVPGPPIPDPVCSQWPYPAVGAPAPLDAPDAPPILLVGTTGDPATPYDSAVAVHEQLAGSVLLTYEGEDHIAYDEGDPCVVGTVDDFLVDGDLPQGDVRCAT
jgi:pimeloyl-ACP methyl ester carboxylesterase